jgi:hypothetical protein
MGRHVFKEHEMRCLASALISVLLPLAAQAQSGTSVYDPNVAPQGMVNQPGPDTQANAEAAYRNARAACRNVKPANQRRDCVAQAMQKAEGAARTRNPSVEVRPASSASAASR